ncbi:S-layer homology domain-containing protein [Cohnella thailandensis]|uniref:S-layer homology domain-containing protein n=1 Tax=Cohnella thailandensis TaxID=557557 RepID=A0A841SXS7_9BACL|nr:S-layer homology domain-containing protein [Cohnella thailandensis]MBB6635005.1 S-layer homology domain-containing protein [Cohnella thailandensis]MBP1975771.1 hypothetical protein [Cohnella thailandensis]
MGLVALMLVSTIIGALPPRIFAAEAVDASAESTNSADAATPIVVPYSQQLNAMDSATNSTGDTVSTAGIALVANADPAYIKEGTGSKKWILNIVPDATKPTEYIDGAALIYPKLAPNVDLNGYSTLKFWAYNAKARMGDQAEKPFQLRFFMKGDSQYYYYRILLDWTGWKEIEVPLAAVKAQKSSDSVKAWGPLDYIRFDQAGVSGTTRDLELNMYLDDIRLTGVGEVYPAAADKPSGEYVNKVTVTLSSSTTPSVLSTVYYKREGIDNSFLPYTAPITLTEDTTLVTKASLNGVDSAETTYRYTFVYRDFVENVAADPPAGLYAEPKTVTLSSATEGAAIFYKIEGVDSDYKPYTTPLLIDSSQTILTKAELEGKVSEEVRHAYEIDLSSSSSVPISNTETFGGWSNTSPTPAPAVLGSKSGQWLDPTSPIDITDVTAAPWKENDQVEFWLYSDSISNKKIYVIISTPDDSNPGNEYFMASFFVDWKGWKKVELPFNKFLNSNGGANFDNIKKVIIHPRWYDSDPVSSPGDKLYFDGLALTKNAIEPSIRQIDKSALPDSTVHYAFSLKNIGGAATAYQLSLKTEFGANYVATFQTQTAEIANGAETDVDVEVRVPASAQAGDSVKAVLNVRPLQGGKETTIEMNLKIGQPREATKQHPYVMASQEQLTEAKRKIQTYDWAQDYVDAVTLKADEWVDKTMIYPSKPGGESTLYVCGNVPLTFNYDKPHEHLCPTDGEYHTGDDLDAAWRFYAHTANIEAARNLAIVYALTGEAKYAAKAREILVSYAALYPSYPMQPLNGRIYYQSLDEAVQIISLAHAYDLIEPSGLLSAAEKYDIEMNLFAPSAKTLQSYDTGKSNWQTWHNAAIGAIGALLEDPSLMDFSVNGRSGFDFQMENSVLSDGFWYEGAIGYHFYAQSALFYHAQALQGMGYDLFANPNFKKTYDVTLQYAFPDLGIINGNDSGKYPTSLAAPGRVVPMDYEAVYAHYLDPSYGALLHKLYADNGRARGGFVVPGNSGSGIAGEQAVFYGVDEIPSSGSLPSESVNFTGIGHSVLRAGEGDDQLYALVDYGKHGGYHGHPDKLHLEIFGKGERLAPDLGIPPYSNSMYESYYKKSFPHNTVLVDGDTQQAQMDGNTEIYEPTKLFLPSDTIGIMTNTAGKAYAGLNRYERTVAVTKDYLIDLFSVSSDTERQYDWILHGMGSFDTDSQMAPYEGPLGTKDAYSFFRNGSVSEASGPWEGAWTTEAGNGLKLFGLTGSEAAPSQMIVGEAPGPGNATDVYTKVLVNRVQAKDAQFVSVLEPYRGESVIESVYKTEAGPIEVKLKDGRGQVFSYNPNVESIGALQYSFADGQGLTADQVKLKTTFENGALNVDTQGWTGYESLTVVVYAPGATSVKWNGEEADYAENNGFISVTSIIDNPTEPTDPTDPTDPVTPPSGTTPQADPNRTEQSVSPESSAVLTLGQELTVTVPAGAVDRTVRYIARKLTDPAVLARLSSEGADLISSVFEITKSVPGTFAKPIAIRLKFDPAELAEGQKPSVHYYDEDKKQWIEMGGTVDGSYVTAWSDHLTKFAVLAVADEQPIAGFKDVAGHWAENEIKAAAEAGIVKGFEDGTFKPNKSVTRSEFLAMLASGLKLSGEEASLSGFSDAGEVGAWAAPALSQVVKAGILHGYSDGTLRPNEELNRAQLAALLSNALGQAAESNESEAAGFADAFRIPAWAADAVARVHAQGLMKGTTGNRFEPEGIVTRAEAAAVVVRLIQSF